MTMRIHTGHWPRILLPVLFLAAHISPVFAIPQSLFPRQAFFDDLKLPPCALTCFVDGVLSDGCVNETDFACHCGPGDIMRKVATCVEQECNAVDKADAMRKVQVACGALGVDELGTRGGPSSMVTSTAPGPSSPSTSGASQPAVSSGSDGISQTTTAPSLPRPSSSLPSVSLLPSTSSMPTDMPLALVPESNQLSEGAKAGIAVSVSLVALSIFFALSWYIRRLKRDLKAAQALADTPNDAYMTTVAPPSRWPSNRRQSPVSPLSPVTVSDNGYGVLKKKRGNVLSVVVEHEEEDRNSLVWEPVPGQREGLSQPLELDAEGTELVEAPLAVTPRERSRER